MQGVMIHTMDTDIWVDLPTPQYIRLWNLIRAQGGSALSQTLCVLAHGKVVKFLFEVTGLGSFASEFRNTVEARIDGQKAKLLRLDRILRSKKAIRRDKDNVRISLIETALKGKKTMEAR